jgi:hypothetical protein
MHDRHDRAERWFQLIEVLRGATRRAVRRTLREPLPGIAVILTFALGIGANAIMFGIVDHLLVRDPAHVARADEVSRLMLRRAERPGATREVSAIMAYSDFVGFLPARLASVAAFSRTEITLGRGVDARQVNAELVSGNYFGLLGAAGSSRPSTTEWVATASL